jgi:aminomethyltransferase
MLQSGSRRKLVGFVSPDRLVPRQGYPIVGGGKQVGAVTSGTFSPSLQQSIGMGYVETASAKPGISLGVRVRDKEVPVSVVSLPFLKK